MDTMDFFYDFSALNINNVKTFTSFYLQDCDCIFHDFAVFTDVKVNKPPEFCNRFKCVKIVGNAVAISEVTNIGEKTQCQPIEFQNTNESVEQRFLELCHETERSYHQMKICFENAATLLMSDEPPTNLHECVAGFIERMIDAYMPLGIFNSSGLNDARNVLNEIRQLFHHSSSADRERRIIEKSNQFYQMIPHIEFNLDYPRKLPPINTRELCSKKAELIEHIEAVTRAIQTGRRMENRCVLDFIYHEFMNVELKPILRDQLDFGSFADDFSISNSLPIKFLFSMIKPPEPADFEAENTIGNVHYLFHSTHLANLIDILREGLRVAPNHVFSYNRWYGRGIYFYGDFKAALGHANRLKQKIILVCRVALGNVGTVENSDIHNATNSACPLQSDKNTVRALGSLDRSTFEFDESYRAFLPKEPNRVATVFQQFNICGKSSYGYHDEFLVQRENQVKIEYVIELND